MSFLITNTSSKGRCPTDGWIDESWCAHRLHFYASVVRVGVDAEVTTDLDFSFFFFITENTTSVFRA